MLRIRESDARIRERGFGYCYWRYGLVGFGIPLALLGTLFRQVVEGTLSVDNYFLGLLLALPAALLAGALFAYLAVWRPALRGSDPARS